jgi:hypothetical protein
MPLPFFFCRIQSFGRYCSSKTSLGDDDILKGLLTLVLASGGDEDKCSLFPFFAVVFVVEGTSSNSGGGGGEKSLCGE